MLPVILGAVALGVTSYGVKKLVTDESFRDDVKDKISDVAWKAYDGIEWAEEKMGLYDEPISINELKKEYKDAGMEYEGLFSGIINFSNNTNEKIPNDFEKLHQFKIDILNKLSEYNLGVIEESDIKKDKTKNITITDEMQTNLASYIHILKTAYRKIKYNMDNKTAEDVMRYVHLIKDLCMTKIIKKGELNIKSTELILKGTNILLAKEEPLFVKLDA